jgi:mRNA interferase MazF
MAAILRGGIYWADLDPTLGHEQSGRRPVLILSETVFNARSGTVIAVALTSHEPRAAFPLTLVIVGIGLPKRSWVKISQIRTLSILRLGDKVAEATEQEVVSVLEGLNEILGA